METTKDIFSPYIGSEKFDSIQDEADLEWEKIAADSTWQKNALKGLYHLVTKIVLPAAGVAGGAYLANRSLRKEREEQISKLRQQIASNKIDLMSRPTFKDNQIAFSDMFDDIQEVAPHVAANTLMIDRIMNAHMTEPLNLDKLKSLRDLNTSLAPPVAVSRASELGGYGYDMARDYSSNLDAELNKMFAPPPPGSKNNPMHMHLKSFAKEGSVSDEFNQERLGRIVYNHFEFLSDAYNSEGFQKVAAKKGETTSFFKSIGKSLIPSALVAAAGYAAYHFNRKKNLKVQRDEIIKSYELVDGSSDLADMTPELRHDAFNALATFAPSIAAKPIAAKTFVSMVKTRGGVDPDLLRQITAIEEGHKKIQALDSYGTFLQPWQTPFQIGSHINKGMGNSSQDAKFASEAANNMADARYKNIQADRLIEAR